jgi:hypothetical protein
VIETTVALAGALSGFRINFVQVTNYFLHRSRQAIKIDAIKAALLSTRGDFPIMTLQPVDKAQHRGVAPHPLRELLETGKRFHGIGGTGDAFAFLVVCAAHKAVNVIGIGPIGLDSDSAEAFFLDETFGDLSRA